MSPLTSLRQRLLAGHVIPALPLALTRQRRWSERRQRAVLRYYMDAGAGGVAVGVHSTQFEIRLPRHGLFEPVLALAAQTIAAWPRADRPPLLKIAGLCGKTPQAGREAALAIGHGYEAGLLSLSAWKDDPELTIVRHCAAVAEVIPLIGFYMQTSVGGRRLSYRFWREFIDIPNVVAIKIAPFNRYQTLDVVRAVLDARRDDVALYTGNDDNIIADLLTPFGSCPFPRFFAGGLLGQWGVWTERAVAMLREIKQARVRPRLDPTWLRRNVDLTDANAAVFDAANGFAGCISGIHEILRRQGVFETTACLNPQAGLSRGQAAELDRVTRAYPWLVDDPFVQSRLARWLA